METYLTHYLYFDFLKTMIMKYFVTEKLDRIEQE